MQLPRLFIVVVAAFAATAAAAPFDGSDSLEARQAGHVACCICQTACNDDDPVLCSPPGTPECLPDGVSGLLHTIYIAHRLTKGVAP